MAEVSAGKIQVVALDKLEPGAELARTEKCLSSGREIVPPDYVMPLSQQTINQTAANKAGTAGYKSLLECHRHHLNI